MGRDCENCRFCIYAHSMRGKEEPYCERHSKWIGDTLLCSEWEAVIVPKPLTNADRIRAMSDEELAEMMAHGNCGYCKIHDYCFSKKGVDCDEAWLDWLRQEAI